MYKASKSGYQYNQCHITFIVLLYQYFLIESVLHLHYKNIFTFNLHTKKNLNNLSN